MTGRLVALPGVAAAVVGLGAAYPESAVDNATLLSRLAPDLAGRRRDAMLDAIAAQLGTESRHHLPPDARDGLVGLAAAAADAALSHAGVDAAAVGFHVHATSTPSRWTTPESARIGAHLRATHGLDAPFMDLRMGCTGGLQALYQGLVLAASLGAPVLVTAADRFSHIAPPTERFAPFVFGDGAAAAILAPTRSLSAPALALSSAAFLGAPQHADLATVRATLPPHPSDDAPWHLSGDPIAFDTAARGALEAVASHFDVSPLSPRGHRVIVSTSRPVTARALAGEAAFTDALVRRGHLGTASALAGLEALVARDGLPPEVVLLGAGGGLAAGGLRLSRLAPEGAPS